MQLLAPAKINLSFRIQGRRPDGFHEIETLMAPISLSDRLRIDLGEESEAGIEFSCDDQSLPAGEDNLVVRAARLFQKATGSSVGVKIALEKKIPHGAGLGGGSSNAASTLLGLNELCGTHLGLDDLMKLAAGIGSDVPFFIGGSAAICRGRGEIVVPAKLPAHFQLLLLKPDFGVATAWAYGKWKESQEISGVDYSPQEFRGVRFCNDLERPVFEKFVFLPRIKSWLREQPEVAVALMSGSGSTLFAVLRDTANSEELAKRARDEIDPMLWTCATRLSSSASPGHTRD